MAALLDATADLEMMIFSTMEQVRVVLESDARLSLSSRCAR